MTVYTVLNMTKDAALGAKSFATRLEAQQWYQTLCRHEHTTAAMFLEDGVLVNHMEADHIRWHVSSNADYARQKDIEAEGQRAAVYYSELDRKARKADEPR